MRDCFLQCRCCYRTTVNWQCHGSIACFPIYKSITLSAAFLAQTWSNGSCFRSDPDQASPFFWFAISGSPCKASRVMDVTAYLIQCRVTHVHVCQWEGVFFVSGESGSDAKQSKAGPPFWLTYKAAVIVWDMKRICSQLRDTVHLQLWGEEEEEEKKKRVGCKHIVAGVMDSFLQSHTPTLCLHYVCCSGPHNHTHYTAAIVPVGGIRKHRQCKSNSPLSLWNCCLMDVFFVHFIGDKQSALMGGIARCPLEDEATKKSEQIFCYSSGQMPFWHGDSIWKKMHI